MGLLNTTTTCLSHLQEELLGQNNLVETIFGFKGHVGDRWVMKETLPRATMDPIPEAVERIKDNPDRLQVSHLGSKVTWVTDG